MGYRNREYRDPYLRKINERLRKNYIKMLKTEDRVAEIDNDIERRRRLESRRQAMREAKERALDQISKCPCVRKDQWYQHLDTIDMTNPSADDELRSLRKQVEIWRILWRGNDPLPLHLPDRCENLPWTDNWLSTRFESTHKKKPSSSVNPVELTLEQEEQARELERKQKESALAQISSSLDDLVSARNRYKSALSNL